MADFWWIPEDVTFQQIIEMYEGGKSLNAIVKEVPLKCGARALSRWLQEYGVPIRQYGHKGKLRCVGCNVEYDSRAHNSTLCLTCAPEKVWAAKFYTHGITKPQFDVLFEKQSGLCDLCELPLPLEIKKIHVDHCHRQGHVRALLHPKCNVGLHYIEDDKFLANAIRYIERHKR